MPLMPLAGALPVPTTGVEVLGVPPLRSVPPLGAVELPDPSLGNAGAASEPSLLFGLEPDALSAEDEQPQSAKLAAKHTQPSPRFRMAAVKQKPCHSGNPEDIRVQCQRDPDSPCERSDRGTRKWHTSEGGACRAVLQRGLDDKLSPPADLPRARATGGRSVRVRNSNEYAIIRVRAAIVEIVCVLVRLLLHPDRVGRAPSKRSFPSRRAEDSRHAPFFDRLVVRVAAACRLRK
jgi:hypothetical protein